MMNGVDESREIAKDCRHEEIGEIPRYDTGWLENFRGSILAPAPAVGDIQFITRIRNGRNLQSFKASYFSRTT